MKTTKRQIQKIIREEIGRYVNEQGKSWQKAYVVVSGYYREFEGVFSSLDAAQNYVQLEIEDGRSGKYEIWQVFLDHGAFLGSRETEQLPLS